MIQIEHLVKSFGSVRAVNDVSFSVKQGEFFAFLGSNGAGKSTTISILCGLLKRDSGSVLLCGRDPQQLSGRRGEDLGVVFQESYLDRPLSVKSNLQNRAALYGIEGEAFRARLSQVAELLSFSHLLNRPVGKLSGGERRRVDIARALFHRPRVLILDEPTTGLDPATRNQLWRVISGLQKEEKLTVLLTTHYMEEAADADRVVILDSGRVVAEGTPQELKTKYTKDSVSLYGVSPETVRAWGYEPMLIPNGVRFAVNSPTEVNRLIQEHSELFLDYEITKGKMDDVFLSVTGKTIGEGGDAK